MTKGHKPYAMPSRTHREHRDFGFVQSNVTAFDCERCGRPVHLGPSGQYRHGEDPDPRYRRVEGRPR